MIFIQSVAASRTGIRSWPEPAAIFVRWQIYHKNQSHKLFVCHHLLNLAAKALGHLQSYCCRAVLAPDVIVRKKYYRLEFASKACNHWLHLLKMQGTFCSRKEQIAKVSASVPWPGPPGKGVDVDKCLYCGRQTCSSGQELSSEEIFDILICFLCFWFAPCVCVYVGPPVMWEVSP